MSNDITTSVKTICDHYKIQYIQLHDIDKMSGHPSVKGHKQIAEQIEEVLNKEKNDEQLI
jgi:lysophospholipase L1-like esterase